MSVPSKLADKAIGRLKTAWNSAKKRYRSWIMEPRPLVHPWPCCSTFLVLNARDAILRSEFAIVCLYKQDFKIWRGLHRVGWMAWRLGGSAYIDVQSDATAVVRILPGVFF